MIPELGTFAIILALAFSILQTFSTTKNSNSIAGVGQFGFLALAMLLLIICFLNNDMSVIFVREHSHSLLPFMYKVGAAWGGHEGSLLLWCLVLSGWTTAFIITQPNANGIYLKVIKILGIISVGFICFLLFTSNPFARDFPASPITGDDLTPILQDPGLIFHPPMLYLGYVGFAISFAFGIAALLEGKLDKQWASVWRPWIILPWAFLGCGIVLGSWWAYRELGWGGWWFWDPVENASLLPWLAATALLHSLIVSEKRDAFKGWTILLAIITFALSLVGTFLVRSGVLVSVHAFASDPLRGIFLLVFLGLLIGSALTLYGYKIKAFYRAPHFKLFSRESLLLINSVIMISAVATIIIGTIYPIILDSLNLEKISVGEPYFNTVFVPLMLPILLLMGIAPHVNWGGQTFLGLWKKLRWEFLVSLGAGIILPLVCGFKFHFMTAAGLAFALWIVISTLRYAIELNSFGLKNASMIVAHMGIAILAIGITINKSYSEERQVKIAPGEAVALAGSRITFKNIAETSGPNFKSTVATFLVGNHELVAEQRTYSSHEQNLSKPGVLANMWRDVYLALGSPLTDAAWSVRIYYKPCVRWIWFGGFLLLLGGLISVANRMFYEK